MPVVFYFSYVYYRRFFIENFINMGEIKRSIGGFNFSSLPVEFYTAIVIRHNMQSEDKSIFLKIFIPFFSNISDWMKTFGKFICKPKTGYSIICVSRIIIIHDILKISKINKKQKGR